MAGIGEQNVGERVVDTVSDMSPTTFATMAFSRSLTMSVTMRNPTRHKR